MRRETERGGRSRRRAPLGVCAILYLAAAIVGVIVGMVCFRSASGNPFVSVGIASAAAGDIAATLFIFIASVAFNNSSVYDPYWSAAPPVLAGVFLVMGLHSGRGIGIGGVAVLVLLLAWAVRLTYNWARGWRGFSHEDWRYADYRRSAGRAYWVVSFLGFHLFPTVLVFLGCLSLLPILTESRSAFDLLWVVALTVIAAAVWIEAQADRELFEFRRNRTEPEAILDTGLWSYSRHPNYFGEVLFWWGIYLAGLAANPSYWWTVVGPLAITALFLFVSVPMMERHMIERHPDFDSARYERSRFVPWIRR